MLIISTYLTLTENPCSQKPMSRFFVARYWVHSLDKHRKILIGIMVLLFKKRPMVLPLIPVTLTVLSYISFLLKYYSNEILVLDVSMIQIGQYCLSLYYLLVLWLRNLLIGYTYMFFHLLNYFHQKSAVIYCLIYLCNTCVVHHI